MPSAILSTNDTKVNRTEKCFAAFMEVEWWGGERNNKHMHDAYKVSVIVDRKMAEQDRKMIR